MPIALTTRHCGEQCVTATPSHNVYPSGAMPSNINNNSGTSVEDRSTSAMRQYELDVSPRSCESNASSFQCFNSHSPPILNLSPNLSPAREVQLATPIELMEPIARGGNGKPNFHHLLVLSCLTWDKQTIGSTLNAPRGSHNQMSWTWKETLKIIFYGHFPRKNAMWYDKLNLHFQINDYLAVSPKTL